MPGHRISQELFVGDSIAKAKKYVCAKCFLILQDAVQTMCGHWMCQSCIDEVIYCAVVNKSPPACPNCNEDLRAADGKATYNVDECVRREVLNLMLVCPNRDKGCWFLGRMPDYKCHSCTFVYKAAESDSAEYVLESRPQREVLADTQTHLNNLVEDLGRLAEEVGSKMKQVQHTSNIASSLANAPVQPVNRVTPSTGANQAADSSSSLGRASESSIGSIGHCSAGKKASLLEVQPNTSDQGAAGGQAAERRPRRNSPYDNPLQASPPCLNFTFRLLPMPLANPPPLSLPDIECPPQLPPKKRKLATAASDNLPALTPSMTVHSNPPAVSAPSLQPPPIPPRPKKPPPIPSRPPKPPATKRPANLPLKKPRTPLQPINSPPQDVSSDGTVICKKCNSAIRVRELTGINLSPGDNTGFQSVRSASDGRLVCHCRECYTTFKEYREFSLKVVKQVLENATCRCCPPRHKQPSVRPRLYST